jgi:hypothetical protein
MAALINAKPTRPNHAYRMVPRAARKSILKLSALLVAGYDLSHIPDDYNMVEKAVYSRISNISNRKIRYERRDRSLLSGRAIMRDMVIMAMIESQSDLNNEVT